VTATFPDALVEYVDRRMPLGEVAAHFGMRSRSLSAAIRRLRSDDPHYPIYRRRTKRGSFVGVDAKRIDPDAVKSEQ
jgi:hypothetical protein